MRQASKPPTPEHPFGHGLQLYFWTFIVAILIFGLGAGVALAMIIGNSSSTLVDFAGQMVRDRLLYGG